MRRPPSASGFLRLLALAGVLLALLAAAPAPLKAEDTQPPAPSPTREIQSIAEYKSLSTEERRSPLRFRLECDVTLYDPDWNRLWIQDPTGVTYVRLASELPIHTGQHIVATGIQPADDPTLTFDNASVLVVGDAELAPTPVGELVEWGRPMNNRLVQVVAVVDRQEDYTPGRQRLYLSVYGRQAYSWLLYNPSVTPPDFRNCLVRINAIYAPRINAGGQVSSLEFNISDLSQVELLSPLARDGRFDIPRSPIGDMTTIPSATLIRVNGRVVSQDPGRILRIRDETGQVDILSPQTFPCSINEEVQAIGHPRVVGTDLKLDRATYRRLPEGAKSGIAVEPGELRLAAQVRELTPDQASRGIPVKLAGIITWTDLYSPFFFMQDSSGGICVFKGNDRNALRTTGRSIEVRGTTSMGKFAPVVTASDITYFGETSVPEARNVPLELALTGIEEAQWVEMRGFVRRIIRNPPWIFLNLATATGDFVASLEDSEVLPDVEGSLVRVRGVCSAETNEHRQLTAIRLWMPNAAAVQIEDPAPTKPFDIATSPLSSLGQFGSLQSINHRVKVSGVVLYQALGRYINLQDGADCLKILTRDATALAQGDRIEAVGFIGRQGHQLVLREAIYRKAGTATIPSPLPLSHPGSLDESLDGHLVQIDALLVDATSAGNYTRMTLHKDKVFFEAVMDAELPPGLAEACKPGSRLSLSGIYDLRSDEHGNISHFLLQLRSPSDVRILKEAPWFTRSKIFALAGALAVFGLLVAGWVVFLRGQVRRQTEQIRQQLGREAQLQEELQRATRLEALGILAGGIAHDFNNLLTVVMGNVALAQLDSGVPQESVAGLKEAEKAVLRARDLTMQLLTFAKGGSPVRSSVALPQMVREVTQFALHGSNVRCDFDLPGDLWAADVDKGQISQVVQNIAINAMQAMPDGGVLSISLRNEEIGTDNPMLSAGRYLKLSLSDTGSGIPPQHLARIFDPYFTTKKTGTGIGLATVYSIIRKHLGHITVDSTLGKGTCFRIWLPAASAAPLPQPQMGQSQLPLLQGRVLIMDDEEGVGLLGISLLSKMGLEANAVPDGATAVREYAKAMEAGQPFDLVILDLTVPGGMGGLQTLTELQRLNPEVKAIVSSGYSNDQTIAEYSKHGFAGVVSKPYELADFARTVAGILGAGASLSAHGGPINA